MSHVNWQFYHIHRVLLTCNNTYWRLIYSARRPSNPLLPIINLKRNRCYFLKSHLRCSHSKEYATIWVYLVAATFVVVATVVVVVVGNDTFCMSICEPMSMCNIHLFQCFVLWAEAVGSEVWVDEKYSTQKGTQHNTRVCVCVCLCFFMFFFYLYFAIILESITFIYFFP